MTATEASATPPFRYTPALAEQIELDWQARWDADRVFDAPNPVGELADPPAVAARSGKLFVLDMFPYPSGAGLHVGHPLGYIGTDVYSRLHRMLGHNVLYSMGFDSFGLPAEQYAVQTGQHPAITTNDNIAAMRRQLRRLGLSHDQRRSVSTAEPEYYRWTQWIFAKLFDSWYDSEAESGRGKARPIAELEELLDSGERTPADGRTWTELTHAERRAELDQHRLAFLADSPVNWCPGLGTVLANEEITDEGLSERDNFPVFPRQMRQWNLRITAYADRLIDDLDTLEWPDGIKELQRNWIGRSTGANVHFDSPAGPLTVFTTRPDTLFGATFLVLAPEHPAVAALATPEFAEVVRDYQEAAAARTELQRQAADRDKTGVFTGSFAVNPMNRAAIPIWIADYVLPGYGTGAIMAVPSGDQRDFDFARAYDLPIVAVQQPPQSWLAENSEGDTDVTGWRIAFVGDGAYINSRNDGLVLDGMDNVADATAATIDWLEATGHGEGAIVYRLRDWLFSRQRYWGEPFPIVYDADGLPHLVPEAMLPVVLPDTDSFSPRTFDPHDRDSDPEVPLARLGEWVTVEMDLGGGPQTYRRDTNVMPQWAGSSWYQLRYLDPTNSTAFVDREVERYWTGPQLDQRDDHPGGVDLYVGGVEHAVLHLLYARFWHKVLFDLGYLSSIEPYARLFNQGYVLAAAYTDARGAYVDAAAVEERDGAFFHKGELVTQEWGKMGKSKKNSVSPDEMYEQYGADTLRLYEMSTGPLGASRPWDPRAIVGMQRFLQRVWRNVVDEVSGECIVADAPADAATRRLLHRTIAGVRADMEALRFNTAIAKLIELNSAITKLTRTPREVAEAMVLMLAPFVPHVAEELWSRLGHDGTITYVPFPTVDAAQLVADTCEYSVFVDGKVRGRVTVATESPQDVVHSAACSTPQVAQWLDGVGVKSVVFVAGRTIALTTDRVPV